MMNVPGTFDWEADEARSRALVAAEPLASLLYEQTLISLTLRQVGALEALADVYDERNKPA